MIRLEGTINAFIFINLMHFSFSLNHYLEDLDVPVITADIMQILLIVFAWRIVTWRMVTTWSRFSHKPYSCTFLVSSFKVIM